MATWVMTDVPIEHHPTIRYMVYNGYYKVMSNIPKMGQLPTPGLYQLKCPVLNIYAGWWSQPLWKILVNGKDYPIYYGK